MAIDSNVPIDSLENASYRDNKTDKTVSIMEKISTGKDEAMLISNKIAIQELINNLENREKEVIILRYYKEKTQTQVAKILGITQVQVSRIEKKVLNSMKIKLVS
jgi:RNA polymerase sporulation-specific sigma factor